MATATSRISLEASPSLIDLPPHTLSNPHVRVADLVPTAAHSLARRVSSESQTPGRASPSSRITRRTPVPFLLEAFPAPPSHIPGTPTTGTPSSLLNSPSLLATSRLPPAVTNSVPSSPGAMSPTSPKSVVALLPQSNPPPSSPPTVPLPPVPGSSIATPNPFTSHRILQTVARSASPALSTTESQRSQSRTEQRPRLSVEVNELPRRRGRQGSLSSLRNPIYPMSEQSEPIAEEPVEESYPPPRSTTPPSFPLFGSVAERKSQDRSRGDSPDILHSDPSRVAAAPLAAPGDKPYVEDSIASVDMSDLNALKSDNEGDIDDQASHPFPRFPPLPRLRTQSPADALLSSFGLSYKPKEPSDSMQTGSMFEDTTMRRAKSPEIAQMITATWRPRKRSTPSSSRDLSSTWSRKESLQGRKGGDVPPVPAVKTTVRRGGGDEGKNAAREDEGNDSDSSLDLHTPLPQLMLRHGMLSPNSKLLPRPDTDVTRLSIMSSLSSSSYASNGSNLSLMSTSSKHPKDARDTLRRRNRHRDGRMLQGGIGLTTGLGWSDSEDEDAPSQLTRRVSTLVLSRRASSSSVASYRSAPSLSTSPHPLSKSISHSVLREADEFEGEPEPDELGFSRHSSFATRSLPARRTPVSRVGSIRSVGSSLGRQSSTYSTSSAASTGHRARAGSVSESVTRDNKSGFLQCVREHDDGVTPTRAAFERSTSMGSLNGAGSGPDPHTPSSTASSTSLPFPATPESTEDIPPLQAAYNHDKVLPPLPLAVKNKYPSSIALRTQPIPSRRPRAQSNASSVSNSSMPPTDAKGTHTSTPRLSLAQRTPKTSIQSESPRPSLNTTPRPSLAIPKSTFTAQSATSGLPRPTTPSSPTSANAGYTPRPLRLAELNQTASKILQPGELPPRPGQVLMYNRNVHDQLKLRALSLNTGTARPPAPVSPGGAQTLFIPSPGSGSSPGSALSTPVTARSQSPMPSASPGSESPRPRPRTGTGMIYRNNLSVGSAATSRIRIPSTVAR